jgi:hypothetical protein
MCLAAAIIPLEQIYKTRFAMAVDLPLHDDDVIRLDAEVCPAQRLHQAAEVAAGVDGPFGAAGLE